MSNYFNNDNSWNNQEPYYSNNNFDIKFVYCPLCSNKAIVKSNKKNKKMLRCDLCYALIFANGVESQQILVNLPEFRVLLNNLIQLSEFKIYKH